MTRTGSISVCMATYNGASHVEEQLRSILAQIGADDEVVVVDDASTDQTTRVIQSLGDPRIRMLTHAVNRGYAAAFEAAIAAASGDLLLLSDQDDVWAPGRVEVMRRALASSSVVAGNLDELGTDRPLRGPFGQRTWRLRAHGAPSVLRTLAGLAISNVPYYGSAMGLRADFRDVVLPFPTSAVELHDAWLAINGLLCGSMAHVDEVVTHRRLHAANTSGAIQRPRSPSAVIKGRRLFVQMVLEARRRRTALRVRASAPRPE